VAWRAAGFAGVILAAAAVAACASPPEADQIAQETMIGLAAADIRACMGEPAARRRIGQATEMWSYATGVTTTETPPWALGLDFSASAPPSRCDVRIVMTNGSASQVTYGLPSGRDLPSGRQCSFPVVACARQRGLL
jgi:hypothetical protein